MIYLTNRESKTDVVVFETDKENKADPCVFVADRESHAKKMKLGVLWIGKTKQLRPYATQRNKTTQT